jgi:hypothetical protein
MLKVFKPHIVEFYDNKFAIRRYTFIHGWQYYDNQKMGLDNYWWQNSVRSHRWVVFDTMQEALNCLQTARVKELRIKRVHYVS